MNQATQPRTHYIDHPPQDVERVRIEPQPTVPKEFQEWCRWSEEWAIADSRRPEDGVVDEWTCPYRPGDILAYREEWRPLFVDGCFWGIEYGGGDKLSFAVSPEVTKALYAGVPWSGPEPPLRPADAMPDWAIRHKRVIRTVSAVEYGGVWWWEIKMEDESE